MPHFDVNVITVGGDTFSTAQSAELDLAVQVFGGIYAVRGPTVGTIRRKNIKSAAAGSLLVLRNHADARALADRWAARDEALDVFVVRSITDPTADGWSPRPGRCGKSRTKGLRTPVIGLAGDGRYTGNTLAHEVGHFLGLQHCEADESMCGSAVNFMRSTSDSFTQMSAAQSAVMAGHCQVRNP